MLIYVCGPYRAKTAAGIDTNIAAARQVAVDLWRAGHYVICPHLNTARMETELPESDDLFLAGTLAMLARCDGIVLLPTWDQSNGAIAEVEYAKANGMPCWLYPDIPDLHPTEVKRPTQCGAMMAALMQMYRTHLDKNADYSPANILGTGELGVVVRLWDKIARLMNLSGFEVEILRSHYRGAVEAKNEAVEDTLLDAAVYAIIGLLVRAGKWGR